MSESETTTTAETSEATTSESTETQATEQAGTESTTELKSDSLVGGTKEGEAEAEAESEAPEYTPLTAEGIEIPEGFELPEGRMEPALELVNKYQLPPEAVNEFMKLNADWATKDANDAQEAQAKAWNDLQEEWTSAVRSDPDIGGDKLDGNLGKIADLIDTFTSKTDAEGKQVVDKDFNESVRNVFNITGAGNNVAMVKFLANIADATLVQEGEPQPGGEGPTPEASEGLYPHLK